MISCRAIIVGLRKPNLCCRIVQSSPLLAGRRELAQLAKLTTVDVMAVRLWLDRRIPMATPSNVAVNFDEGVGATFFDLTVLQVTLQRDPSLPRQSVNTWMSCSRIKLLLPAGGAVAPLL